MRLGDLQGATPAALEGLYGAPGEIALPRGSFRGVHLGWIAQDPPRPVLRFVLKVGFELTPFGVDFDRCAWWFGSAGLPRVGRFAPSVGPSRWRDTQAVRLHYDASRLPAPLRRTLYDEVKPLTPDLCLGLGGINAPRGAGEQFYFALTR